VRHNRHGRDFDLHQDMKKAPDRAVMPDQGPSGGSGDRI
jgi:hypothetical protein